MRTDMTAITAPTTAEIAHTLYAAQNALSEARAYIAAQQTATAALTRVPATPTPLFTLLDEATHAVARTGVRMEIPDQSADTNPLSAEDLARLLSDGDVHVNGGDYPHWDALAEDGRDQYRTLATFLIARCTVSHRSAA
jgi:hypothetical protein